MGGIKYSMEYMWNIPLWAMWGWNDGHCVAAFGIFQSYSMEYMQNMLFHAYSMEYMQNITLLGSGLPGGIYVEYSMEYKWNIPQIVAMVEYMWNIPLADCWGGQGGMFSGL